MTLPKYRFLQRNDDNDRGSSAQQVDPEPQRTGPEASKGTNQASNNRACVEQGFEFVTIRKMHRR